MERSDSVMERLDSHIFHISRFRQHTPVGCELAELTDFACQIPDGYQAL
jgi:hypothetical protein